MRSLMILLMIAGAAVAHARDVGSPAPDAEFAATWMLPIEVRRLSHLRGDVVLLEFWATW
jgi:hypothetical protein